MPESKKPEDRVKLEMMSAAKLLPQTSATRLSDHCLDLRWSPDSTLLAAMPCLGQIELFSPAGERLAQLPEHPNGNGAIAWHPSGEWLLTYGQDAEVRIYEASFQGQPKVLTLEKAWAERAEWSPNGEHFAVALGKCVAVFTADGLEEIYRIPPQKSTICDISWNPSQPDEFASVCDGGVRLWKLGKAKPMSHFDWGGASLLSTWSPDGRWVVTGDQVPSVHLYDVKRKDPLHIQGYETKVKALAWEEAGAWLATGGGRLVTIWPCSSRKGPNGATPIQLSGHLGDAIALDFSPGGKGLVSGGRDGLVLLWMPQSTEAPALISHQEYEITRLRWSPNGQSLAVGTKNGDVFIHTLTS